MPQDPDPVDGRLTTARDQSLFAEINAHGRTTEQKQMAATLGYLALVGAVAASSDDFIGGSETSVAIAAAFLFVLGVIVFVLTLVFRAWKVHYMDLTKQLAGDDWLGSPMWLSADKTLIWTLGLVVVGVGTVAGIDLTAAFKSDETSTLLRGALIGFLLSSGVCLGSWSRWRDRLGWR